MKLKITASCTIDVDDEDFDTPKQLLAHYTDNNCENASCELYDASAGDHEVTDFKISVEQVTE